MKVAAAALLLCGVANCNIISGGDPAFDAQGYFQVERDTRKCAAPLCGGYWVSLVNSKTTTCADGTQTERCYVAEIASKETFSMDYTPRLLKGVLSARKWDNWGVLGQFTLEADHDQASTAAGTGLFVGVRNNGLACIRSPCPNTALSVLNLHESDSLDSVRFDATLDAAMVEWARTTIAEGVFVVVAGTFETTTGLDGTGTGIVVNQIYRPVAAATPVLGYFQVERDTRKCAAPLCGGYWVSLVNSKTTTCADGTQTERCYVAEIASKETFSMDYTPRLLKGVLSARKWDNWGVLGQFTLETDHDQASTAAGTGLFVGVRNIGLACIRSPCPNTALSVLNLNESDSLDSVRFDATLDAAMVEWARTTIAEGVFVVVAGTFETTTGLDGTGTGIVVNQIYRPVAATTHVLGYFQVERDTRKCAAPLCGGYWVSLVNSKTTTCADGTQTERCYVAEIASKATFSMDDTPRLLKGVLSARKWDNWGVLGQFTLETDHDQASTAAGTGLFVGLRDTGLRCIRSPCPNVALSVLNLNESDSLDSVRFDATLDAAMVEWARTTIAEGVFVVVAGTFETTTGLDGKGTGIVVNQIYRPVAVQTTAPVVCLKCPAGQRECSFLERLFGLCALPHSSCAAADSVWCTQA